MNFDPAGVLGAILSSMAPPTGAGQAAAAEGVEERFGSLLEQIRAVIEQHSTDGLALTPKNWEEWIRRLESSVSEDGAFLDNLRALQAQLQAMVPRSDGGVQGSQLESVSAGLREVSNRLDEIWLRGAAKLVQTVQENSNRFPLQPRMEEGAGADSTAVPLENLPPWLRLAAETSPLAEAGWESSRGSDLPEFLLFPEEREAETDSKVVDSLDSEPDLLALWQQLEVETNTRVAEAPDSGAGGSSLFSSWRKVAVSENSGEPETTISIPGEEDSLETMPLKLERGEFSVGKPSFSMETEQPAMSRQDGPESGEPRERIPMAPFDLNDPSSPPSQEKVSESMIPLRDGVVAVAPNLPGGDKTPQTAELDLSRPFDHPEWASELGERLLWMHGKTMQVAQLRVNPQHLGPIEVRIQIRDDQTNIQFSSQHAVVRDAIESALPRLREMFGLQQLQLAQVDVTGQSLSDQRQYQPGQNSSDGGYGYHEGKEGGAEVESTGVADRRSPISGDRLLNLYA